MFYCKLCKSSFNGMDKLRAHLRKYHSNVLCDVCGRVFTGIEVEDHECFDAPPAKKIKLIAANPTPFAAKVRCAVCEEGFTTRQLLRGHLRSQPHQKKIEEPLEDGVYKITSAFKNRVACYRIPSQVDQTDVPSFLDDCREKFIRLVGGIQKEHRNIKANVELFGLYIKPGDDMHSELKSFNTRCQVVTSSTDLGKLYHQLCAIIKTKSEEFQERDSGWTLLKVSHLEVNCSRYTPIRGSSYLELPPDIKRRKACINVRNDDEACFAWAVTAALHPIHLNSNRITSYPHYTQVLNLTGLELPFKIKDIHKFEELNNISINVYGLEFNTTNNRHDVVGPIHFTRFKRDTHVNLLYIEKGEKGHYVWIKNLSRLVSSQVSTTKGRTYLCDGCLTFFTTKAVLLAHSEQGCKKMYTIIPTTDLIKNRNGDMVPGNLLQFTNFNSKMRVPFTFYADFKSILTPNLINLTHIHKPYSFAYYIKCSFNQNLDKFVTYTGLECPRVFMERLSADAKLIYENHLKTIIPMTKLSPGERYLFDSAEECHICEKPLVPLDKVADHCHLTGKWVGAAHSRCNLNFKIPKFLPIFVHNLSGHDAHAFIKEFDLDNDKIDVIPQTKEKYISFSKSVKVDTIQRIHRDILLKLRFLDSFKFMPSSSDKLAEKLKSVQLKNVAKHFPIKEQFELVTKKRVFPFQYMDSINKLEENKLPPAKSFFNPLTNTGITSNEYEHAENVWQHFNCRNLREYSDLYLKTDVLLLADIFENFRDVSLKAYNLDPSHYYTASALSWDAMLKSTDIKLELLTDIEMHNFIHRGIRGGINQCSQRHARANNKYMTDYDETKPSKFLTHWNANNLYLWAMSQLMPHGKFKWLKAEEIQNLNVSNIPDDSPTGYFLEVDVEYPAHLHDLHNDLPFLVEKMVPPGSKFNSTKLIASLNNKQKYVIHYRNLKQALANGLKLIKIHRVISFEQSDWLKKYIYSNTSAAENDFEKDFYKLMNDSVFGKILENVDKRVDVKLVNHWGDIGKRRGAETLIAKPNFNTCSIFTENLIAIQLDRLRVVYNKPIYISFSVLDLSKSFMYDFYYDHLKPKYADNATLCYMDTDSFVLNLMTDDLYKDDLSKFDSSDFDPHNQYRNEAVLGLVKDELGGKIISEFVGLRSKMYAVKTLERCTKKANGVKKCAVAQILDLEDFRNCLFNSTTIARKQNLFTTIKHTIFSATQNKLALSPHDDKRHVCEDGVKTLAWGHRDILNFKNVKIM